MRSASLFLGLVLLTFTGCSSDPTPAQSSDAAVADDTSTSTGDGGSGADTSTKTDAGGGGFTSCDAACKTMAIAAHVNSKTFPFERAQFGMSMNEAGVKTIHVELHSGGSPLCPSQTSPNTDRTIVLAGVVVPIDTTPSTEANNVKLSVLDFKGDMYPSDPIVRATAVKVTPIAASALTAPPGGERFVALSIEATVKGGDVKGTMYATHCDSLDD
jgi:hypothetical protein